MNWGFLSSQEVEAAEAARQEMVRQQRNAKRALLKEADKKEEDEEDGGMTGMTVPRNALQAHFGHGISSS